MALRNRTTAGFFVGGVLCTVVGSGFRTNRKSQAGRMSFPNRNHFSLDDVLEDLIQPRTSGTDDLLPSVEGVVSVAADVRELMFPGFRRLCRPHSSSQILEYRTLLNRLQTRLRLEIGRALVHSHKATLRIHSETGGSSAPHGGLAVEHTNSFLASLPALKEALMKDVQAAFDGDPAAITADEIILCYPGIEAVMVYRLANQLHRQSVPYLPRILSEWAHRETGIDIHPGATIGPHFFIDHGTGVVIGETTIIGSGVTLYQGVTLGAWSFPRDENGNLVRGTKRHPTLEDGVTVYSNASILGGDTIVGTGSQIGSGVTLSRSVPPNTMVTVDKPSLKFREAG